MVLILPLRDIRLKEYMFFVTPNSIYDVCGNITICMRHWIFQIIVLLKGFAILVGVKYRTCEEAKDMYCVVKLGSFLYKDIVTGIFLYIYFILLKVFLASTMETLDNWTISKVTI